MSLDVLASDGTRVCEGCGAELAATAKFCRNCGKPASTKAPPPASVPKENTEQAKHSGPDSASVESQPPVFDPGELIKQPWVWAAIAAIVLLGAGLLGFWLWRSAAGTAPQDGSIVTTANAQTLYTTRAAFVRNMPTALGSQIVGRLPRGESVQGVWTSSVGGSSQWLQVKAGPFSGSYVSATNLSSRPRPAVTRLINRDIAVGQSTMLRELPDAAAAPIEPLSAGLVVHAAAEVEGGWLEIERKAGGVGYIPVMATGINSLPPG